MQNGENSFCKKLVWQEPNKEKICLYGLILSESETHLTFKTAHKKYFLNKNFIIKIEDTNRPFFSEKELTDEEKNILNAKPIRGEQP